ncbi:NADPH:quinone reductase [Streptomyces sulfonofaciens]|uniref:NADPH:quinone reductase n=1 Tax=Streptomyces sulfonofaciens TaxID=68272 RepID=A0A919L8W6_9ACTN|nr:NADP-dependent oxidoreductase [Streptomyces sulfonofaciens]GHH89020.1 NADPH:quinone reductase [Streptomyces sulfonofaciens]
MSKAVRMDHYGGREVLYTADVQRPVPGPGEVLVQVRAAGTNPGETKIREGAMHEMWPASFPQGQGSDLAGTVAELGPDVDSFSEGDEVIGYVDTRSSQAEFAAVPATQLTPRPAGIPWEVAGSLKVAGSTAWAGLDALDLRPGETLVIAGATGGVGSLAVQLARRAGVTVMGVAGPGHQAWLAEHGAVPVVYGPGVADRIRQAAPDGVDAFFDAFGSGYVQLAVDLGVAPERINTVVDPTAVEEFGARFVGGAAAPMPETLGKLADLVAAGELKVAVARTYPLTEVAEAYRELEEGHPQGKIVLVP